MAGEDRDRLFEKALAHHLRADGVAARALACLDAEVLAAYQERQLSPEQMSAAQEHVASCLRCQEIVARLDATRNFDKLQSAEDGAMLKRTASALNSPDSPGKSTATIADRQGSAEMQSKSKVAKFPGKGNSTLRWAAPAGALAAGLLLWIGLRDFRAPRKPASESSQIAENRSEASPAGRENYVVPRTPQPSDKESGAVDGLASDKREKRDAPEQDHALKEKASSQRYDDVLRDEMQSFKSAARPVERASADKKTAPVAPPPPSPAESRSQTETGVPMGGAAGKTPTQTENADRATAPVTLDSVQVASGQTKQSIQQNVVGGIAPPPKGQTQQAAPAAAPMSSNETVAVESQSLRKDSDLQMMARPVVPKLAPPLLASAENGKYIWRFGEHGSIVHSSDGGKTWRSQTVVTGVTLTSGSAPSKKICWIAGASGTLLRTENAGKHWQLVTTPILADLGGVVASDAKHATIWDADHRLSYETFDGGATWRQIHKE